MKKCLLIIFLTSLGVHSSALNNPKSKLLLNQSAKESSSILKTNDIGYKTSAGFRFGLHNGITIKHFISSENALEFIIGRSWGYKGFSVTGIYEIHKQAFEIDRLFWYYGAGGHIGWYDSNYQKGDLSYTRSSRVGWGPVIGVDGILGLEYQIKEIPFTASFDIKPAIDFIGWGAIRPVELALSVRYVF
jgi:hypothetical protein